MGATSTFPQQVEKRSINLMMRFLILLTLGVSLSLAVHDFVLESANNDFSGFKVYRALPTEDYQTEFLENLQETTKFYDFWSDAKSKRAVDIMTSPGMDTVLEAELMPSSVSMTRHMRLAVSPVCCTLPVVAPLIGPMGRWVLASPPAWS